MSDLRIETLVLGMLETNCYLLTNSRTRAVVVIDPADEARRIVERIEKRSLKPEAILLTHGHFDHIGAVSALCRRFPVPVLASAPEEEILLDTEKNLSAFYSGSLTIQADRLLADQEELQLAGFQIRVLHTPGHTAGSVCYYLPQEGILFSGDTLFRGSVGRTDFPTGSMGRLHESLHATLFSLPAGTMVYPGHGEETDIGYERRYNPY